MAEIRAGLRVFDPAGTPAAKESPVQESHLGGSIIQQRALDPAIPGDSRAPQDDVRTF